MSPSLRRNLCFEGITDVYGELVRLYDESVAGGFQKGRSIYEQHFFFTNPKLLYAPEYQEQIKMVEYAKQTHTPPYPDLQNTPAQFVDEFFIIQEELKEIFSGNQ